MAQSKGRAEASLADAAQHRKRRLKELMAEQELALNLGSATGTRCSSVKGEACSASCEGLSECEIAGRAQHQTDDMGTLQACVKGLQPEQELAFNAMSADALSPVWTVILLTLGRYK